MPNLSFDDVLQRIMDDAESTREQGTTFEKAVVFFLQNDPLWAQRFSGVWLWNDAPTKKGTDIGIDVVARDAQDESYWAIQCKCFQPDSSLTYHELSTFFSTAAADERYGHYMIVDTAGSWSPHLIETADAFRDKGTDVVRVDADALRSAELDWGPFLEGRSFSDRTFLEPREHQREAIDACLSGFAEHDRGKLVMACGTGKTLTSLRLAEKLCPGGTVLYLAPSISLVAQTMRYWANQSKAPLRPFVVCSDAKSSEIQDQWETSVSEVPYPATTDPAELARRATRTPAPASSTDARTPAPASASTPAPAGTPDADAPLTVVFSTYQSIQVVIDAQNQGLPAFDLCVCDEAHRTTGVSEATLAKDERSAFVKVHDATCLHARKRLYMTATPRMYSDSAKKKAHEESFVVASMDDEQVYGPEFYRLKFGEAVERGLLADYRVMVFTVSEDMASAVYQQTMAESTQGFDVPDVAKILGCWKALATRGEHAGELNLYRFDMQDGDGDYEPVDFLPMQRAVAFSATIAGSKDFTELFGDVMSAYEEKRAEVRGEKVRRLPLEVKCRHVDGTMSSTVRKRELDWLAEQPEEGTCRVLSNARCLSEGVDVPNLDAVMFMAPKDSQVDIVQAVGRVMRKAEGKEYGYIILPVVVPAGQSPEASLDDDRAFQVVWQVLQALRSHDERLDAKINAMKLEKGGRSGEVGPLIVSHTDEKLKTGDEAADDAKDGEEDRRAEDLAKQLAFEWDLTDWENAMEAKLIKKCGSRVYWEDWADDVADIAKRHIERIRTILDVDESAADEFSRFLAGLRDSLNPGVTRDDAIEMLAQHIITKPVFEALFGSDSFAEENPVSVAMEDMLEVLNRHAISMRADDRVLEGLYASVRSRVAVVTSGEGRQAIVKELYEKFFSRAFKATSEKMGIVYTPGEVVDYILHATDCALRDEFGRGLTDEGVHILDPFAGTGTFMAQLIEGDLIADGDLERKYIRELHSNEIMLLPYYIMTVNIEQAWRARRERAGHADEAYRPFEGAVLTDTFQMHEAGDTLDVETFVDNSERVLQQLETPIQVIVGNPPYSVGQTSANDNNQNEKYPTLDGRIADTYAAGTNATNKNSLYDSYIRAFRWASDRIGKQGVICFVTNAGWVDGAAMDGMRRCLAEEFTSVHVFHLRGNQRTQGEESRREGGKIFGSGSRAPIAITMLVKNPGAEEQGRIFFHDIGDYLTREEKLSIVRRSAASPRSMSWEEIHPDRHGDWLDQRDDSFCDFAPMGLNNKAEKGPDGMFNCYSRGNETDRDAWIYNFSLVSLQGNVQRTIGFYSKESAKLKKGTDSKAAASLLAIDPKQISWSRTLRTKAARKQPVVYNENACVEASYRPFCKQWAYADAALVDYPGQIPKLFPLAGGDTCPNVAIIMSERGPFITNILPDLELVHHAQCFPLYYYDEAPDAGGTLFAGGTGGLTRHDAITDEALSVFRRAYPRVFDGRAKKDGGAELTKEDLFYYAYAILHSPEYRSRFAANLAKELPRIPLAGDFAAFSKAGRALAELHLGYETAERWAGIVEDGDSPDPGRTEKMRWGRKTDPETGKKVNDYTVLEVTKRMTLRNIPEAAQGYVVNGKSALAWLVDRYQVRTDKASGIVNDCNAYSDDPRYITDLVERVTTVSMKTIEIVASLPALSEREHPENWPAAWTIVA